MLTFSICKLDRFIPDSVNILSPQGISRQLQIAELAISRIQFLEKKFKTLSGKKEDEALDDDIQEFVSQLLSTPDIVISGGPRGKIGKLVAKLIENNQVSDSCDFHSLFEK